MSISADTAMKQAPVTANYYMCEAIEMIDHRLGDGYAAKHPELISAFMSACVMDFDTAMKSTSR